MRKILCSFGDYVWNKLCHFNVYLLFRCHYLIPLNIFVSVIDKSSNILEHQMDTKIRNVSFYSLQIIFFSFFYKVFNLNNFTILIPIVQQKPKWAWFIFSYGYDSMIMKRLNNSKIIFSTKSLYWYCFYAFFILNFLSSNYSSLKTDLICFWYKKNLL